MQRQNAVAVLEPKGELAFTVGQVGEIAIFVRLEDGIATDDVLVVVFLGRSVIDRPPGGVDIFPG